MRVQRRILLIVLITACASGPAYGQWVATPYLGGNVSGGVETGKGGLGVSVGYFGSRLGFEFDVERYQHFFKDSEVSPLDPAAPPNCTTAVAGRQCTDIDTDAVGFMGNVLVPVHFRRAAKFRPYGTAGLGGIRAWTNEVNRHQNNFGFNGGGGLMYMPTEHVGLRGDVRYFRALVDENARRGIVFNDYGFWRVTLGVAFGFQR